MDNINSDKLEPYHNAHANFILMCIPMLEVIDALKQTNMYKQGLKKSLNDAVKELEKADINERLASLWDCDEEAVNQLTERYKNLCKRMATATPEMWSSLETIVEMLIKRHDYVLHRLNILYGNSSEIKDMERREDIFSRISALPMEAMPHIENNIKGLENIYITN